MSLSTRTIFLKMKDSPMGTFLANWVMFEELLTSIYSSGQVEDDDLDLLGSLRYAVKYHYNQWAELLRPYWTQVKVAGSVLSQDPFLAALENSTDTVNSTSHITVEELAAVRKTLNLMLSDRAGA